MEAVELVVTPKDQSTLERDSIQRTDDELHSYLQVLEGGRERRPTPPKLVFEDGRQLELSPSILQALHFVLHHMARGDAVGLVPRAKMLTTNQAAEILNVSRPFLIKLLNERAIKFTKIGTHRRLQLGDVLRYKQQRDRQVLDELDELAREAQEAGNYFDE